MATTLAAVYDDFGRTVLIPAADVTPDMDRPYRDRPVNDVQAERDRRGITGCTWCGRDATASDPMVVAAGYRVHGSHASAVAS